MKLTVIGNYGPYPTKQGTATSCYLYEENNVKILLDFGSGAIANLSSVCDIKDIDYIFISHLHYDHTSDLLPLRYLLHDKGKKINIITEYSDSEYYKLLFDSPEFEVINVDRNSTLKIANLELSFYRTAHPVKNLGIKIKGEKTFTYTGDTIYFKGLEKHLKGADVVLIDGLKDSNFKGPHLKTVEAIKLQNKLKGKYILTHESDYNISSTEDVIVASNLAEYEF